MHQLEKGLIVGIDVGTTETKAILVGERGDLLSESSSELPLIQTKENWIEQDIQVIWKKTAKVIENCIKDIDRRRLLCISVTGQRETICPLDRNFEPLRKAISWQDARGWKICKTMKQELGFEEIYKITGLPVNTMPCASKIAWIKENEQAIYDRAWKFVGIVDYIVWKLSGQLRIDFSNACRTMLFDIAKLRWSERIIDYLELDLDKMPELIPSGHPVGNVTKKASEETDLPTIVEVVYAGGDQQCSALGVGITEQHRVSCVLGTCTNIEAYSDHLPLDKKLRLQAQLHVIPNSYLVEGGIGSSGSIYRWFRDNLGERETLAAKRCRTSPYAIMDAEAEKVEPGSSGLIMIPYFTGSLYPYWNADDRGMFVGLRLSHKRGHLLRAILEGIAYEYMRMAEDVERITGTKIDQVRFMGGGAKSKIWPKIIVDVLGVNGVVTKNTQAGAMGAAILGSKACDLFKDIKDAAESMVKVGRRIAFDRVTHERYRRYCRIQGEVYGRIQDLVNELSQVDGA